LRFELNQKTGDTAAALWSLAKIVWKTRDPFSTNRKNIERGNPATHGIVLRRLRRDNAGREITVFERFKARHREKADAPTTHAPQKTELMTHKPSIWGISIDLKELARRSTNLWRRRAKQKGSSLSFVSNDRHCHWSGAKLNDQSGTFVNGRWHVTNSSESDVMILKARLGEYETRFAQVSTRHPDDERPIFGNYPIQSHRMSEVSADFTFFPPIGRAPKRIISDVIFTDNFGNEHRVRTRFSYIGPGQPF
jgi:hypothetical protein